ncbi:Stage 0 sporulation protein M [Halobacillus karajensis]|uniref:Stage 0 sporulation protein M n=1 Tax=Halobacillus karajensis TaxID=195088 RepID=A0A024P618_9BACI|nr:Stage 0 sporulation protein M [Halobacillus karajensis]CDQ24188.1 Stage 0 sporulation protein M [Halobacillus karajensis]CDQ29563.1 Stage 0 sporulation protein M [Halobacillus karajensis]
MKKIDGQLTLEYDTTINSIEKIPKASFRMFKRNNKGGVTVLAKLFSWFGPGLPKVDLVLSKTTYTPGDQVTGAFHLKGGVSQQTIQRLECDLMKKTPGAKPHLILPVTTVLMNRELEPKEESKYPFHFVLPKSIDLKDSQATYHLHTKLVLKNDVKTSDIDEINIQVC